jgi:hypothetical protein
MDNTKKAYKKSIIQLVLILVPVIFTLFFFYDIDTCYIEWYFTLFTFTVIFLLVFNFQMGTKNVISKKFKWIYFISLMILWLTISYYTYIILTQFINQYEPCSWVFKVFLDKL